MDTTTPNFAAIIPARYASTRFPGKPLADLGGKPVIEHVYRRVRKVLDTVLVATDDERIAATVKAFGGVAIMTSPSHPSGTDRVYEAYVNSGINADVIINIQGDEPFVDVSQIKAIMSMFSNPDIEIATLAKPYPQNASYEGLADPNKVKVTIDNRGKALYFSRSVIPYMRNVDTERWPAQHQFYIHLGMYAYRAEILRQIVKLEPSTLELAESLEQLRWLQNGYNIGVGLTDTPTIGIDTPQDLENARKFLNKL